MIRTIMSHPVVAHVLFLTAGLVSASLDRLAYRLALITILTGMRILWLRLRVQRTSEEAARYGARRGISLYRQATSLPHEATHQNGLDRIEVGR